MRPEILGIHHVTAIATVPQVNLDFYAGVLGLRLVKRTVNFDDPGTYHLYYGDGEGRPGTIMTFFPWPLARRGSRGSGQVTVTAFSVPEGSLGWWRERLAGEGVIADDPIARFDEEVMTLLDPDGLMLELVAHAGASDLPPWREGPVPEERSVRGLRGVTLAERQPEVTAELLVESLGLRPAGEWRQRQRFVAAGAAGAGARVDVLATPELGHGRISAGTVHHVALRAADEAQQLAWRERLLARGLEVTPVLDRQYFRSIYFREPGGVLFEIATDAPGFAADEPVASLGAELKLPPWLEPRRAELEATLPPLQAAGEAPPKASS
jgi:glyoxalase family protein